MCISSEFNFLCFISWCLIRMLGISADLEPNVNMTNFLRERQKRSLIFEGGGQIKFVIGPIFPLDFGDPIMWRSMICTYNLHGGHYDVPTEPLYPWDKWEDIFARSMRKVRRRHWNEDGKEQLKRLAAAQYWTDDSRLFVYTMLERYMNQQKATSGRACLLRSICENAQVQQHVGIFAEMLSIVLTPGKESIDPVYHAASEAGKSGLDCLTLYQDCPMGHNILDRYLELF